MLDNSFNACSIYNKSILTFFLLYFLFLTLLVFSTFQTLFYVRFTLRGLNCLDKALAFAAFACAFVTGVLSCVLYIIYWLNYMFEV